MRLRSPPFEAEYAVEFPDELHHGLREVDELDCIGAVEDGIGHRFADAHASDLRDDVVEALDVLDVEGRIDVDAAIEQLLDVEIALGVPASRRVRVRELVD